MQKNTQIPRKPELAPKENLLNGFWYCEKPHLEKQI